MVEVSGRIDGWWNDHQNQEQQQKLLGNGKKFYRVVIQGTDVHSVFRQRSSKPHAVPLRGTVQDNFALDITFSLIEGHPFHGLIERKSKSIEKMGHPPV